MNTEETEEMELGKGDKKRCKTKGGMRGASNQGRLEI